jgi:hypothetical protein
VLVADALQDAIAQLVRSLPQLRAAREREVLPHVTEAGRW